MRQISSKFPYRVNKVQSSKLQLKFQNWGQGFTLIELIVVISILVLMLTILSRFLFSSLSGSNKAEILKEVRQNGSYALSTLEGMIFSSSSVACSSDNKMLSLTNAEGLTTLIVCDETNGLISSNSARLTGANVSVSDCSFSCLKLPGKPAKVDIDFWVSQKSSANLRPSEKASLEFKSVVVMRNY